MTCVLLDDELPGLQYLKLICQQIPGLDVLRAYDDPRKFIRDAPELAFDFAVLDINMPGIDGLAVAEAIRGRPVIFVTAHKEYAADAFDLDAVDYIRKPLDKERFEQAIRKLDHAFPLSLNAAEGKVLIYPEQVIMITSAYGDSRDKHVLLDTGREVLLKNITFPQLLTILPHDKFRQINKRMVINVRAVSSYNASEVVVKLPEGKTRLLLSEAYRAGFRYKK